MGMRDNIMRLYDGFDLEDYRQIDQLSQESASLFRLALLHAVIVERLKFGALAWNVPYECNPSDSIIGRRHL
jgi:dynein heavy chain